MLRKPAALNAAARASTTSGVTGIQQRSGNQASKNELMPSCTEPRNLTDDLDPSVQLHFYKPDPMQY
eukprot:6123648-Amphidinium_carterae.1